MRKGTIELSGNHAFYLLLLMLIFTGMAFSGYAQLLRLSLALASALVILQITITGTLYFFEKERVSKWEKYLLYSVSALFASYAVNLIFQFV